MKFDLLTLVIGLLMLLSTCLPCLAFIPVIDVTAVSNLIKSYNQLRSQYDLLNETYRNAQSQLLAAQQLTNDSQGSYGIGSFLNGAKDLFDREWSPASWQRTLSGLSGANPQRYNALINAYQANHPTLPKRDFRNGASLSNTQLYQQDKDLNQAAVVNASYSFNDIQKHLSTIHLLSSKIDQLKNIKASSDLNARLLAEVAYIQTQELKMQVILNQQIAQQNSDKIKHQSDSAQFNRLPTK